MAIIKDLPTEVLIHILSGLHILTIEEIAKTFTHPLTDLCLPILKPILIKRREKARFINQFGMISNIATDDMVGFLRSQNCRQAFRLSRSQTVRHEVEIPDVLDSVILRGDLKWLKPLDQKMAKRMEPTFEDGPPIDDTAYESLLAAAERFEITLPPVFLKFIRDAELVRRIFMPDGFVRFSISEPPIVEDQGGYFLPFYYDGRDQGVHTGLYFEPGKGGSYCVVTQVQPESPLGSRFCGPQLEKPEKRYLPNYESWLEETEFEAFLMNMYYSKLVREIRLDGRQPSEDLQIFVEDVYIRKRRR